MARSDEEFQAAGGRREPVEENPVETPDADAAEQATAAYPDDEPEEVHRGLEVDEYDAVEQSRVVDLEEEYR
jgi:hypothetical protein